jgi:hypothetical protein
LPSAGDQGQVDILIEASVRRTARGTPIGENKQM